MSPVTEAVTRVPGTRAFPVALLVPLTVRLVGVDGATSAFAGEPQPVEIHHRGLWYSGELLGWRHESDGRVLARVRCVVDKLRHSAWKDLAELRLPDPARPPRAEPFPAPVPRTTGPDEDDATRPHVLLAGLRTRPAKPAHAVVPPSAPPVERPVAPPTPRDRSMPPRPARDVPAADRRRWTRSERTAADLSGV